MFKILPFKNDSTGAAILARELPGERIDPNATRATSGIHNSDIVVNWGCGWTNRHRVHANQPEAICKAVNKFEAFRAFRRSNIPHPIVTRDRDTAEEWLSNGDLVYARQTMEGERGRGVSTHHRDSPEWVDGSELPNAVAYIHGFPTKREFRVHVAFGRVIEVNEKKRRNNTNPNPLIRSHRDWVFCVYNLAPYPDSVGTTAVAAVAALGLDFGGVDLGLSDDNRVCVFEVNTAPWINRESTWTAYTNAIKRRFT